MEFVWFCSIETSNDKTRGCGLSSFVPDIIQTCFTNHPVICFVAEKYHYKRIFYNLLVHDNILFEIKIFKNGRQVKKCPLGRRKIILIRDGNIQINFDE
jgi:hypothetical protein